MSHIKGKWKDLIVPAVGLGPGGTVPSMGTVVGNIRTYEFQTGDLLYGAFEIQHDYQENTDMYVHVHWAPTNTNTGNIVFDFEYTKANWAATFPASTTISVTEAAPGIALTHMVTEFPTTISGTIKIGEIIAFRLLRQATGNTFTGNALMFSIGIHYRIDITGSNLRMLKN